MSVVGGVNAAISAVALFFFCASIAGSSLDYNTIYEANWAHVKLSTDNFNSAGSLYVGLKAAAFDTNGQHTVTFLNSCGGDDGGNICQKCGGQGGSVSLALNAVAIAFAFFSVLYSVARITHPGFGSKFGLIGTTLITFCVGLGSFGRYRMCFRDLDDQFGSKNVFYGPGFGCCVVGSALMIIAFFLSLIPTGSDNSSTAGSTVVRTSEPAGVELAVDSK